MPSDDHATGRYACPVIEPTTDSEQTQVRKAKRTRFLDVGIQPYPADLSRSHTLAEVRAGWGHLEAGQETDDEVTIGGRAVFIRNTGKLAFATLQDGFTVTPTAASISPPPCNPIWAA